MQAVLTTTAQITLPAVGIGTAILTLPSGIAVGTVTPWFGLLWLSAGMIAVGAAAWAAR